MTRPNERSTPGSVGLPNPDEVNEFHRYDDLDNSPESHHHTLGVDPNQACFGDHTHDGRNSKILSGLSVSSHTHTADLVAVTPTGAIASSNVQDALSELDTEKATTDHLHTGVYEPVGHTHTAQTAATTAFTPVGLVAATDVQAAIAEVDNEKQTKFVAVSVGGSRANPEQALKNLLQALEDQGIIIDNTVA